MSPGTVLLASVLALGLVCFSEHVHADDDLVFELNAIGGRFEPSVLNVPAKHAFTIHVKNSESTAIEFESFELHRERAVQPGETITVLMPSLSAGTYAFFDDFHHDTPEGSIVVK